jgi:hypothetical protein
MREGREESTKIFILYTALCRVALCVVLAYVMSESLSLLIREIHMAGTTSTYLAGTTYLAGPTWLSGQIGMYKIHNNNKEVPKLLLPDTTVRKYCSP